MTYRDCVSFFLALSALFGIGCTERPTPTEVPAYVAPTPTPMAVSTPTATPIPQPASLSGRVTKYSGPIVGTKVECQGKSTTTASDGTYAFTGLWSGPTLIRAYSPTEYEDRSATLASGANVADFFFYE